MQANVTAVLPAIIATLPPAHCYADAPTQSPALGATIIFAVISALCVSIESTHSVALLSAFLTAFHSAIYFAYFSAFSRTFVYTIYAAVEAAFLPTY